MMLLPSQAHMTSQERLTKAQIGTYTIDIVADFLKYEGQERKWREIRVSTPQKWKINENIGTHTLAKLLLIQTQKPAAMEFEIMRHITTMESKYPHAKKIKLPKEDMDFNNILQEIEQIWAKVPKEEIEKIPKDASENLDNYLYGYEK